MSGSSNEHGFESREQVGEPMAALSTRGSSVEWLRRRGVGLDRVE